MAILQVQNLTKTFKDFTAVNNISFDLLEGEILGFLGPNGAGKTTTIQMLLDVLTPTSGTVKYFGMDMKVNRSEILDQVNFSSTYTNLPLDLTVYENLHFISYLYSTENRKERINEVVEIFKLSKLLNQSVKELSTGQVTRVNLAKSFINKPRVLLLDEPTASLDPDIAQNVRNLLKQVRKKENVSIIFTSHNMAEVEEMCDRIIFINNGKIVANDTPANLAKDIKASHVQFMFIDNKIAYQLLKTNEYAVHHNDRYLNVNVKEDQISKLLKFISDNDLVYTEISISKPSLSDYFLAISNTNHSNET